jgi:hypothetical protein
MERTGLGMLAQTNEELEGNWAPARMCGGR